MSKYDRAITVFSPDGRLFQVEYAMEAVSKGTTAVAAKGNNIIVFGVEKKLTAKMQDPRTVRKIYPLDDHICCAVSGIQADARVLVSKARKATQSHYMTYHDPPSVEWTSDYIANLQQKYTQSGGVRPFGISCIVGGFSDGESKCFVCDPTGTHIGWDAVAIGRQKQDIMKYLEDHYPEIDKNDDQKLIDLVLNSLKENIESSNSRIQIAVLRKNEPLEFIDLE